MMMLTRWHPMRDLRHELRRLPLELDRLFGRWGVELPAVGTRAVYPPVNLWEDEEFVYAEAELPGLKLQDLEIIVSGEDQLTLKGKRESSVPDKVGLYRQERGFGSFERVLTLPTRVDPTKVDARLEHGILTIKMARSAATRPRKITVKAE